MADSAVTIERTPAPGPSGVAASAWQPTVWQVWLAVAALFLLAALPALATFTAQDTDDYMRLLEVRDWLNGQSWFDVTQYRMDPPAGASMHWSRLVDLPIGAFLLLFRQFVPERTAEIAAMTIVPLLELLVAMALVRRLLRALGASDGEAIAGMAAIPLFPLLMSNFLPLRIDHHAWQAIAGLAVAWLMVRGGRRSALAAGVVTAAWLSISLEGMALAALFGGLFAVRYWLWSRREHEAFLLGLAAAAPAIFLLTRPESAFGLAQCDVLSWPHFLAFAVAGVGAGASRLLPGQDTRLGRLAALGLMAAAAAPAMLMPLGVCAVDPMADLDPVLQHYWFENITEGMPITSQPPSVAAMLLWTLAVIAAGARIALKRAQEPAIRENWTLLTVAALGAGAISLAVMRAGVAAQLLALPFAAVLLMTWLPRARALPGLLPRLAATLACLGLATPTIATAALKPLDGGRSTQPAPAGKSASTGPCDYARLNALPPAKLFAPLDPGPEILVRTPHSVIMGNYHRNQAKMLEVFRAFAGPIAGARAQVEAVRPDYLVACTASSDLPVYAAVGPDTLAGRLLAGRPPQWLDPVAGFEKGPLKVYRVR